MAKSFPIEPPIDPMLAKLADALPPEGAYLYEPKWVHPAGPIPRQAD